MSNELIIKEKYSKHWPTVTVVSLILSITFFFAYNMTDDVLWVGYLRLAAFSCFAISLLSFFKVFDGQVEIAVTAQDDFIESDYKVRDVIIFNSKHPHSDFYNVKVDQLPNKSLYNDFMKSDKCVRFRRKDEAMWFYFNEIESRVIPLSEGNAKQLCTFLENHSKV